MTLQRRGTEGNRTSVPHFLISTPPMQPGIPTRRSDCQSDELAVGAATGDSLRSPANAGLRILIVEDDKDARSTLQRLLELDGYHVETASDGLRGAESIELEKPDVALVDIALPELDGYQVARRVRSSRENDNVYLVALTGFGRRADKQLAKEAGFDAHFAKPLDFDALERMLVRRSQR